MILVSDMHPPCIQWIQVVHRLSVCIVCVCVCVGMDAFVCRVCVYIKMCVNLSSRTAKVSPDTHYFHITAWAWFLLFSFCRPPSLTYIYRHKTTAFPTVCSLSICLSLTLEREEEEEPEYKCTQTYLTQAERLLHFSYNSYTGNKKTKKRRKGKKKGGSIILASMLWSQNTDTYSFVCFRLCFHLLICSWSKSQSYYALTSCVSQYRKKGRFVVVLSSHLRCSPFKRGTDSLINYVTVNEWAGGLKRSGVPPVPPSPRIPPLHSL